MKEKELERLTNLKKVEEELYNEKGLKAIAGIDEAGRGPLAGPVVVACALMPKTSMIEGVNDSKKVSEKKREKLYEQITQEAIAYSVGIVDQKTIDEINILNATKLGVKIALEGLKQKPDIILVAWGIPAQEKLIYKHLDKFDKGIFVGVGGSFDVISGHKKRAPKIFIKLNLEWLYRIIKEPKRLKRFYDSNVKFLFKVRRYR